MTSTSLAESLPRPVGFVLGGGGSLGAAQVGMLQALAGVGLTADLVAGTSIGAINGALVAADPHGAPHRLSRLWLELKVGRVLPGGWFRRVLTVIRSKIHLYETPKIGRLVGDELGASDIEDLPTPYLAMAIDADTTEPVVLDRGPVITAMLASSAIPGVFPPVRRDGRDLYDGGLVANVPALQALAMGAKSLVVLDCAFPGQQLRRPTNLTETALYAFTIQMRQQALRDLPLAAERVPVLSIPGPEPLAISPLDFARARPLIASAYGVAHDFLARVRLDGPGLYSATSV